MEWFQMPPSAVGHATSDLGQHPLVCMPGRKKSCYQCHKSGWRAPSGLNVETVWGCQLCKVHLCKGHFPPCHELASNFHTQKFTASKCVVCCRKLRTISSAVVWGVNAAGMCVWLKYELKYEVLPWDTGSWDGLVSVLSVFLGLCSVNFGDFIFFVS